ncbi:MAG: metalloregulator ArsR/SmtB family transcription factor [Actinomycetes bacterium]
MNNPAELAHRIAPVMKALSDENRLAILLAISGREQTVADLTAVTGLSQTLVSHHLKTLRASGLVSMRPDGRSNIYSMCCTAVTEPIDLLVALATPTTCTSTEGTTHDRS